MRGSVTRKNRPLEGRQHVVYYRVSDPKQERSGLGLKAQQAMVETYIPRVKGTVRSSYVEIETGKRKGKRPQLAAAIAETMRHKAVLVIAKLDRLARNTAFIANLMDTDIDFVALDLPAANRLTLHIMAAMAEHEGEAISGRTVDALGSIKALIERQGFYISRKGNRITKLGNPRWQDSIAKARAARKTTKNAELAVDTIRRMHTQGKSLREIAQTLNSAGLKTVRGGKWHATSIRRELPASEPIAA